MSKFDNLNFASKYVVIKLNLLKDGLNLSELSTEITNNFEFGFSFKNLSPISIAWSNTGHIAGGRIK